MIDNDFWNIAKLPEGAKPISCKWISINERDSKGNTEIDEAHLVVKDVT